MLLILQDAVNMRVLNKRLKNIHLIFFFPSIIIIRVTILTSKALNCLFVYNV